MSSPTHHPIRIYFNTGSEDPLPASDLDSLRSLLADSPVKIADSGPSADGSKSAGAELIAELALGVSALSTLVAAVSVWVSSRPRYQAKVKTASSEHQITTMRAAEAEDFAQKLLANGAPEEIEVSARDDE
jgi:hypothetical protein